MTRINQESWNNQADQLEMSGSDYKNSDRLTDVEAIGGDRMTASLPKGEYDPEDGEEDDDKLLDDDDDDAILADDDLDGSDLDTDNADEWDEDDVSETDLDEDDLSDDDEDIADRHAVKNDQFGSLVSSAQTGPDPDEIPEEHDADSEELDFPDDDELVPEEEDEMDYKETMEVEPPVETEYTETKDTTTASGDLDPNFESDKLGRTTGRMIDHEPGSGSTFGEHGAYNL